jgi:hypothetical protein
MLGHEGRSADSAARTADASGRTTTWYVSISAMTASSYVSAAAGYDAVRPEVEHRRCRESGHA